MPASKKLLSVAIITLNEEKNIGRCLRSVQEVANEIIVVDSFSTDQTEKICRSYPKVTFIQNAFEGHVQQKNFAMHKANYEWILSLDADEALDEELKESIQKWKSGLHDFEAAWVSRQNYYCGKPIRHSGWYPDWKLRLWRKGSGEWGGQNPHDRFILYDRRAATRRLAGHLLHYSYDNLADHYRQAAYFSSIAANALYARNIRYNFLMKYFSAAYKWFYCYCLRLGFLDGKEGWHIAKISALANYLKYHKLEILHRRKSP